MATNRMKQVFAAVQLRRKAAAYFALFAGALFLTGLADIPGSVVRAHGATPFELTIVRTTGVSAAFCGLWLVRAAFKGLPDIGWHDLRTILAFAVFGVVCANGGTTYSVSIAPDYVAIPTIFALSIATSLALGMVYDRSTRAVDLLVAVLLSALVAGLLVVVPSSHLRLDKTQIIVPVLTGVSQGIMYKVVGDSRLDPWSFYSLGFAVGGALLASMGLLSGEFSIEQVREAVWNRQGWIAFGVLTVVLTVVPYTLMRIAAPKLSIVAKGSAGIAEPVGGVTSDTVRGEALEGFRVLIVFAIIAITLVHQAFSSPKLPARPG